ncbi:MAG: hypothetical protein U9N81_07030 [Bacillota bacterium]|nr:hypothetical protein [Bacillota bacterium]
MITIKEALFIAGVLVVGLVLFAVFDKMRMRNADKENEKEFSLEGDNQFTVQNRMDKLLELEQRKKEVWNQLISNELPAMGFSPDMSFVSEVGNGIAIKKGTGRICLLQLETYSDWQRDKTNLQMDTWRTDYYVPTMINTLDIKQINLFQTYPREHLLMSQCSRDMPEQEVDKHPRLVYEQTRGTGSALDRWKRLDENCVIVENRVVLDIIFKNDSPAYHKLIFNYLEPAKEWYDLLSEMI